MARRTVAVGLVVVFALLAASPLLACGGWQASAAARHACCATMGCAHGSSGVDACCAQKESTRHSSQPERAHVDGTITFVVTSIVAALDAWHLTPDLRNRPSQIDTHPADSESPLYLRYTVLRV